ncbi:MAG: universal stress protein [Acidiferrobacterales bacterium]|nr:universal stress protein [Acidiferrobacterales bacterium]
MSIHAILVPTDGGDTLQNLLEAALVVARRFEAHISVLHVSERKLKKSVPKDISKNLKKSLLDEEMSILSGVASEVEERVEAFARKRRIELTDRPMKQPGVTISFHHERGKTTDVMVHWSRMFDTTAVMRPTFKSGIGWRKASKKYHESIMMQSGRPVLLVPPQWEVHKAQHAVVAWNHSLEASRAVAMTYPWLVEMKKVTVVVPKANLADGEKVVENLAWNGAKAELMPLNRRTSSVGKRLLRICDNIGADFLVMGGYSHSRVQERVFGGTTEYVLQNSKIITVMVH